MGLFTETLDGWASWCRLFRSLTAFEPLVRGILRREGLPCDGLVTAAGPGTNAVFRAGRIGELVVKIFAPPESGIDSPKDYEIELYGLERAGRYGVPSPALCAHGVVEDRYRFAYLVMAFQPGEEAGVALRGMDGGEKRAFARRLRALIDRLSDPPFEKGEPVGLLRARAVKNRSVENPRWAKLPAALQEKRLAWLEERLPKTASPEETYVHGDICGDNVLLAPNGQPVLIDFADAVAAPRCYDYPPIVVDLFDFDPVLVRAFRGEQPPAAFAADCLTGLFLHDFGQELLETACRRLLSCSTAELQGDYPFGPLWKAVCRLAE